MKVNTYSEIGTKSDQVLISIRGDENDWGNKISINARDYQTGIELIDMLYIEFNKLHEER